MTPEDISVAIADIVQDHVTLSIAPLLSDVKSLQVQVAGWEARWNDLGALRERLAVVEAKSVLPSPVVATPEPAINYGPFMERVAAAEAQLKTLGDIRDRVVTVETKVATPPPAVDLGDLPTRLAAVELKLELKAAEVLPIVSSLGELTKDIGAMRERIAVVETRPAVPGPKGDPGDPGKDGKDGAPGLAGLSYEGVYQEGKSYDVGNLVTWGGSMWHANDTTTTKPGEGSKDWTLTVKRGRDGKDGRDAVDAVPVVAVGRR